MKLEHLFERKSPRVTEYDSVEHLEKERVWINRQLIQQHEKLQQAKDEWWKKNVERRIEDLHDQLIHCDMLLKAQKAKQERGHVDSIQDTIYQLARKHIGGREEYDEYGGEVDIEVHRSKKGSGVLLDIEGHRNTDSGRFDRRGWGRIPAERPPELIYIFPKGNYIWAWCKEPIRQVRLGSINDIEKAIKSFSLEDFEWEAYTEEVEGSNPYD